MGAHPLERGVQCRFLFRQLHLVASGPRRYGCGLQGLELHHQQPGGGTSWAGGKVRRKCKPISGPVLNSRDSLQHSRTTTGNGSYWITPPSTCQTMCRRRRIPKVSFVGELDFPDRLFLPAMRPRAYLLTGAWNLDFVRSRG